VASAQPAFDAQLPQFPVIPHGGGSQAVLLVLLSVVCPAVARTDRVEQLVQAASVAKAAAPPIEWCVPVSAGGARVRVLLIAWL